MPGRLLTCFVVGHSLIAMGGPAFAAPDLLIADFEGEDYGEWIVEGEAFGRGPAPGTLPNQMPVSGFQGERLVNSFFNGDGTTGTLTSPDFEIERPYIHFLVGGGKYPGETSINLLVDGEVVCTATGPNDRPGGSERLDWHTWDVTDFVGRTATIRIVDRRTGGWGHINVDYVLQSDDATKEVAMDVRVEKRYLNLPIKNGATMRRVRLMSGAEIVREFEIELADADPDFWVFLDLAPFQGTTLTVQVSDAFGEDDILQGISQDDEIKGAEDLYREQYRPQFHFSSRRGWNNDPNGLVYYQGEYHLFYQHNPYGWKWGNMHWGHAVSPDLVHWTELPIAIYPHRFGDWVFSGSAAVDWGNTAGLKTGGDDVIIAAFTSTGRGEAIAYSNNRGRTFTDYQGNPVVEHRGRDPKIIWYEPGKHWAMAVYDERDDSQGIAFYTSPDLKTWEFQSRIDGYYECPEIFEVPVDGDPGNTRWIVYAANGEYAIGGFDGQTFTSESGKHPLNYGNCFYASQTYSDIPAEDGRRVQIAWGQIGHPEMPFNQMMDFPVELALRTTEDGLRLFAEPVREIELLHETKHAFDGESIREGENLLQDITGELFHIRSEIELGAAAEVGFSIRGTTVTYDTQAQELSCLDRKAPLKPIDGRIRLELLVDRMSIEIYANDGRVYMPMGVVLPTDDRSLAVSAKGGAAKATTLEVYELKSIWE